MDSLCDKDFTEKIQHIVNKSKSASKAIEKLTKLKYPNSDSYIKDEHAKYFYEKFMKIDKNIKINKDFTKKSYNLNSNIFKSAYCC